MGEQQLTAGVAAYISYCITFVCPVVNRLMPLWHHCGRPDLLDVQALFHFRPAQAEVLSPLCCCCTLSGRRLMGVLLGAQLLKLNLRAGTMEAVGSLPVTPLNALCLSTYFSAQQSLQN